SPAGAGPLPQADKTPTVTMPSIAVKNLLMTKPFIQVFPEVRAAPVVCEQMEDATAEDVTGVTPQGC
ncbi:hypothetical protein, partial [Mycolicibacterium murale]